MTPNDDLQDRPLRAQARDVALSVLLFATTLILLATTTNAL